MSDFSIFGLLNTGMLGIYTHKLAMNVVGHNIANANTPGYSRQRPNIIATPPMPMNTLTNPMVPLQIGTGSKIKDIQRVRDDFLDVQYRQVSNRYNYWDNVEGNLHYIEQLFGEPGETGIRNLFDSFWASTQELISDPTNEAAKGQIVSRATELKNTMVDLDYRLSQLQDDTNNEIKTRVNQINTYFKRIADLNDKIRGIQLIGATPNDLLDERDRILDQLSELVDLNVNQFPTGEIALRIGDRTLLNGGTYQELKAYTIPGTNGFINVYSNNVPVQFKDGKFAALFKLRDEIVPKYRKKLDEFAINLADGVNLIHQEGWDSTGSITGANFFKSISASKDTDDARLFRIAGYKYLKNGPVNYITSKRSFNVNGLDEIKLLNPTKLVSIDSSSLPKISLLNGNTNFSSLNTAITNSTNTDGITIDSNLKFAYNSKTDNLTLENNGEKKLSNRLLIDVNGTLFSDYGFKTKQITAMRFNKDDFVSGSFSFDITDSTTKQKKTTTIDFSSDLNSDGTIDYKDMIKAINSDTDGYLKAFADEGNGNVYITGTEKIENFDIDNVVINDSEGIFSKMKTDKVKLDALDTSEPTLNNIIKDETGNDIRDNISFEVNGIKITLNPETETLNDIAEKINALNTGVTASFTPNGRFVLRGGNSIDFNLRNSSIKGPDYLFASLGLIDDDTSSLTGNDITLISVDKKMSQLNETLKLANVLKIDNGLGLVNRLDVLDSIKSNPSTISIDLGKVSTTDWKTSTREPVGLNNPSVWEEISKLKTEPILNDGKDGFSGFLASIVAEMGVQGETASKMKLNSSYLKDQIDSERERVKGVSIDEEMSNLIKYQQAFNASTRVINAVDEMIQKVVNGLGLVGR
ncbi:flagellar hook-associated protein FlgK [Tepiditoga spiralis]|uniref:Flagellar hook-associated protein 1 n=1 Tax=Tepiditoga spiralis TaxID=2108365 RepID=A0A7G1G6E8_9BACT|nr:flagellar hook-associated protein FlgK [Tepiditoga spiralis]BBE30447.1 flagellar hook-associated protein FlgK [Tepiditoga spiralis]